MLSDEKHQKIQNIIRGGVIEGQNCTLTDIRNILSSSFETNTKIKKDFEFQSKIKEEQASIIKNFAEERELLYDFEAIQYWYYNTPQDIQELRSLTGMSQELAEYYTVPEVIPNF